MSWVAISLIASAVSAFVSIFDKTVMYRYARAPQTLPLLIGIAQTAVGAGVLLAVGVPPEATLEPVAWGVASGVLFGLGGQIMMRVLYTQEVSRTIPVFQTFPIFTALIAIIFLDERINALQWAAIAATVGGAVLLSLRFDGQHRRLLLHRSFFLLMLASMIAGSAHVTGKIAVDAMPVLFTHGLRMGALGVVFLLFNVRKTPLRDLRRLIRARSPALLVVGTNEVIIANAGLLLALWALSLGPVSLVTALVGTRSLFVVLYSTAIALAWKGLLGEETSPRVVAVKIGSTVLIVVGVAGIVV